MPCWRNMTGNPGEVKPACLARNANRRSATAVVRCLAFCASLPVVPAGSAPQGAAVLYDQGPTRPLADYVEPVPPLSVLPSWQASQQAQGHAPPDTQILQGLPSPPPPEPIIPGHAYPLDTPGLTPGPMEPRRVRMPQLVSAPFFLVGNDPQSIGWLARFGGRLAAMGAVGFLVKAESEADLQSVRRLAPGIPITPLDATPLAKALGLAHYPVLVTAGWVEQ